MTSDSHTNKIKNRCGYVAIVGRPNVGKSTMMNHILKQKLSITSRKPQTTRHNVVGIKTEDNVQAIYVDTPGMHLKHEKALNRYMNRAATTAIRDVDVVVFIVDRLAWNDDDDMVVKRLQNVECPIILAINKIDQIDDKETLLPHLQILSEKLKVAEIIPISALKEINLDKLESLVAKYLPENDHFYPEDQITDRSSRFLAAEIVREKITRQLGDELPYQMTVEIEEFVHEGRIIHISAVIHVERDGQKRILIGEKGAKIKQIGQQARIDMETLFDTKVMLKTWVKVKSGWSDDERALQSLGYDERKS
jgi:GTP-binding protein Era